MILYDIWERQNYGDSKRLMIAGVEGRMNRQSTEDFFGAVKILCLILSQCIHVIIHMSKPKECTKSRLNGNVIYGLRVIMMCQYRFIHYNKYTIQVENADNGGRL